MLGGLVRWIIGGGLSSIADQLAEAHKRKLDAANDADRIRAEVEIEQLQARQRALIGGDASWLSKAVQAAWAAPFVIYTGKVVVWDKVLGWGVTDPLGPYEQNLGLMIAGFYFLAVAGRGLAASFRR